MKRRTFLQRTTAAATVPVLLGGFPVQVLGKNNSLLALSQNAAINDRVLVLVQLNGGNDGLNTVLPLDQYTNLSAVRSNVLIPDNQALLVGTDTGLHPAMQGIKQLWDDQKLGILQSVGYPEPNFSHFRSTDIWHTGSPSDEVWESGWLGRYLELQHSGFPIGYPNDDFPDPLAITIGSIVSTTCQGMTTNLGMAIGDPSSFNPLLTGGTDVLPNSNYGTELGFLRQSMEQTNQYLQVIQAADSAGSNQSALYDQNPSRLAEQLKIVARLIKGGLQTKIYVVSIGGFDTHANQVDQSDPLLGAHTNLLTQVSTAIEAFQDDLELLGLEERVIGMTYSEFGRRIQSNSAFGTDHGAAAPMFVFGTNVNPMLHGSNPIIPAMVDVKDSLPMQFDFRSVYGSILADWFCVDESVVQGLLYDGFQKIPVLNASCELTSNEAPIVLSDMLGQSFPNPADGVIRIPFQSTGGRVIMQLFDSTGKLIHTIVDQDYAPGEHELEMDTRKLAAGTYVYRMQHQDQTASKMLSVIR
ncbi:MAG: DUF1501 domain-containing protein, partial [Bacteroidota bacterium]